uniref:uncharacterized protein LOC120957514 n=1 Tax=Anopheles coluzzii TaxID=1518534 RepID=UPI0020FFA38E|nr:uncharacterized protein LOC120957514 [Anopheles coluzzii]
MEYKDFAPNEVYHTEKELLECLKRKDNYSLESNLSSSKALLRRQVGKNGDNLYDLLVRLVTNLLENAPADAVDHFEEYCRLAKIDFLNPDPFPLPGRRDDSALLKQAQLAKQTLQALTQIEDESVSNHSKLTVLIHRGLNTIGWDLPRGYDYFISAQIERTLRDHPRAVSCEFWGILRSLHCDYYVLEVELREKSVDYCAYRGVIGERPEIVTDIIEIVLDKTLQQSSEDILQHLTAESLEDLAQSAMKHIVDKLQLVDREIEEQYCRLDMETMFTELIDRLSCISGEPSSDESSTMLTDPCAASRLSVHSTASMLRIRLERLQLESRLNKRMFLVSQNPRTQPWHVLPDITLEQLEATEGLRIFLQGNLDAPVPQIVKPFDGVEKNLLRALVCKISSHRDCHINGSETNLSLVRCLSGMYSSVVGYNQELLQERAERWWERKEQALQYWLSETWPGLCTFNDGEQFRCFYVGWGLERRTNWYCPIVRIPKMAREYEEQCNSVVSQHSEDLLFDDNSSSNSTSLSSLA